MLYFYAPSLG